MTIKLDKVVSVLAALSISTATLVTVTDAQAGERGDSRLYEKPRCEGRVYGPSHHPARKQRRMECPRGLTPRVATKANARPLRSLPGR